jgi:hypothetical protein
MTVEEAVRGFVSGPKVEHADDPCKVEWRCVLGRSPESIPVEVA